MHTPDRSQIPLQWKEHDKMIRPYLWSHRIISWGRTLLGLSLFIFLFSRNSFARFEWGLKGLVPNQFVLWLTYFGMITLAWEILGFPFSVMSHWVEKRFKLSKQNYLSWFWDKVKGWLLGGVLGGVMLGVLFFCIDNFPDVWWFVACSLFVLLSIVLAQLAPVLLIPLFFKLKPMENSPLKERLFQLCEKFCVSVKEIYHLGLGEKTEKGNAAFVGLGKTKRIIIGDTLYEKFSQDEVEAVFAHELGHQVHNDLWKGIGVSSFFMFLTFFLTNKICEAVLFPWQETNVSRPYGLLLFFILLGVVNWPVGVFQSLFSRYRERLADLFADETTLTGERLADALEKLTIQNRGQFCPHPVIEFFTFSHPAPWRRILGIRKGAVQKG